MPPTQPIRCKTKTNRDLVARVFLRLAPVTCICFEFLLVHCDWTLQLLWFWFHDTQLKTALTEKLSKLSQSRYKVIIHSAYRFGVSFVVLSLEWIAVKMSFSGIFIILNLLFLDLKNKNKNKINKTKRYVALSLSSAC